MDTTTQAPTHTEARTKVQAVLDRSVIVHAPWGNQRKRARNAAKFAEIRADIKQRGIDTPLAVRPSPTQDGIYELLAGYGRLEICELENINEIPVVVHYGVDESESRLIMAAENLSREDLHVVDAANAARDTLAELNGDKEALEAFTGWSRHRIELYFQLLRCSQKVQDLVDNKQENNFTVTLAHANELSGLPPKMQDTIIDSVVEKKMSVKDLRNLIKSRLERPLKEAIFDQKDCSSCKFNKLHQVDMFAIDTKQGSICTNVHCFNQKEREYLDTQLVELEKEHGKIIFHSAVRDLYVPVSKMSVGNEKYTNKCLSCSKFTSVLMDEGKEINTVKESQCLNIECSKQRDTQMKTATTHDVTEKPKSDIAPTTGKKAQASKGDSETSGETKTPEAKVTNGVNVDSLNYLQEQFAPLLCSHETYGFALMAFALRRLNKFSAPISSIPELMKLTPEQLSQMVHDEIKNITTNLKPESSFNGQELAILAGSKLDNAKETAILEWEPTKAYLESMQKPLIQQVLEQSGFIKAFTDKHEEKGYAKLLKMDKKSQIEAILAFNFDWSHYCPDFVLNQMK